MFNFLNDGALTVEMDNMSNALNSSEPRSTVVYSSTFYVFVIIH
ncbi:MAG: hypothetical protein ACJAVZ_003554 [Afipia broomeae]|jgi:hypothetical protein